ncbi:hypothetical protein TNCV_4132601 [Trichonephila clavipes]|nr:hypothetical protein TNCV_4132601 [Trichonephila clavipes]
MRNDYQHVLEFDSCCILAYHEYGLSSRDVAICIDWNPTTVMRIRNCSLKRIHSVLRDDNMCIVAIMADKDILESVQSSKNIEADFDDENETNNVAPVQTSSEIRNVMKSMRSYIDAHSEMSIDANSEMKNKMNDWLTISS